LGRVARRVRTVGFIALGLLAAPAVVSAGLSAPADGTGGGATLHAASVASHATGATHARRTPPPAPRRPKGSTVAIGVDRHPATKLVASPAATTAVVKAAAAHGPGQTARPPVAPSSINLVASSSDPALKPPASGWGCAAAFAYLAAHANPSFSFQCPGWADGHQAMTCVNVAGLCPGIDVIVIATPCPAAYENEAWNSNHIWTGPFDPYGSCSGSQAEAAGASPPTQSPGQESTTLAPLATGIPTQIASLRLIL